MEPAEPLGESQDDVVTEETLLNEFFISVIQRGCRTHAKDRHFPGNVEEIGKEIKIPTKRRDQDSQM